jgi:hypothetical protein
VDESETLSAFPGYSRREHQRKREMMDFRGVVVRSVLLGSLGAVALLGADFSAYRGVQLGASLLVAAKQAGVSPTDFRTAHKRPALIQEMDWVPRSPGLSDPVKDGVLYFVNGELYRIAITYDRYKVEGMTTEDVIETISATYGPATRPVVEVPYHSIYGETAPVEARWEDEKYSYNLVQTDNRKSFAMILYSKQMETVAEAAIAEGARLDAQEAPQKEVERQKQQDEEERLVLEKARAANKPKFRP